MVRSESPGLVTWAIDSILLKLRSRSQESQAQAMELLDELISDLPSGLSAHGRSLLSWRLDSDQTRELWFQFIESLVTSRYDEMQQAWQGNGHRSALEEIASKAHQASRRPDVYSDEVRDRILDLYARGVANASVPLDLRRQALEDMKPDSERRSNRHFTNDDACTVLIRLIRYTCEPEIEVAAARLLRDELDVSLEHRDQLRVIHDHVQSPEAIAIIEGILKSERNDGE